MAKSITLFGIMVSDRAEVAPELQEIITKRGSDIIGRMGIPSASKKNGLITLIFEGELSDVNSFRDDLTEIPGILVQTMSFPQ